MRLMIDAFPGERLESEVGERVPSEHPTGTVEANIDMREKVCVNQLCEVTLETAAEIVMSYGGRKK